MVKLCNYKTKGIAVYVEAHIKDRGLEISGQDLGSNVEDFGGTDEYEYYYSLTPIETEKLYHLLKADSKLDIDLLELIKLYFSDVEGCENFRKYCEKHNIPFGFFNYC